jgi:hypothetical protein
MMKHMPCQGGKVHLHGHLYASVEGCYVDPARWVGDLAHSCFGVAILCMIPADFPEPIHPKKVASDLPGPGQGFKDPLAARFLHALVRPGLNQEISPWRQFCD